MKKIALIYLLSHLILIGNTMADITPVKPRPTQYDKKQDIRINTNERDIIGNAKDIDTNTTNISSNDTDIATNVTNIGANTLKNTRQDTTLTNHNNRITNNSNRINDLDNRIKDLEETQTIIGLEGRIYDSKKCQINIFADYSTNRNKVDRTGVRFVYKFGKSYEEKRIEKLEKKLNKLIKEEK